MHDGGTQLCGNYKIITIPAGLKEEEMEAEIQLEADYYIFYFYALEEVSLDFDVLGPTRGNFATVDVLLGCVSLRKPRI